MLQKYLNFFIKILLRYQSTHRPCSKIANEETPSAKPKNKIFSKISYSKDALVWEWTSLWPLKTCSTVSLVEIRCKIFSFLETLLFSEKCTVRFFHNYGLRVTVWHYGFRSTVSKSHTPVYFDFDDISEVNCVLPRRR